MISPSTAALDRVKKLTIYARERVSHAWLVDPLAQTLEVLRLESGRWSIIATHHGPGAARIEPFDTLDFDLALLWDQAPAESKSD